MAASVAARAHVACALRASLGAEATAHQGRAAQGAMQADGDPRYTEACALPGGGAAVLDPCIGRGPVLSRRC